MYGDWYSHIYQAGRGAREKVKREIPQTNTWRADSLCEKCSRITIRRLIMVVYRLGGGGAKSHYTVSGCSVYGSRSKTIYLNGNVEVTARTRRNL